MEWGRYTNGMVTAVGAGHLIREGTGMEAGHRVWISAIQRHGDEVMAYVQADQSRSRGHWVPAKYVRLVEPDAEPIVRVKVQSHRPRWRKPRGHQPPADICPGCGYSRCEC